MTLILLADGFSGVEAVSVIDILRRADIHCRTVGITGKDVTSAQNIPFCADCTPDVLPDNLPKLLVLPGGRPGVDNLMASEYARYLTARMLEAGRSVGAICAAPLLLAKWGLASGRTLCCHPTVRDDLTAAGATVTDNRCQRDGALLTGNGPGASVDFGLHLVALMEGTLAASKVAAQFNQSYTPLPD